MKKRKKEFGLEYLKTPLKTKKKKPEPEEEEVVVEKKEKKKDDTIVEDFDFILGYAQTKGLAKQMDAKDYIDYLLHRPRKKKEEEA